VVTISETEPTIAMSYLTGVVPSDGGALVTWFTLDDTATATWRTRAIDFDGTARSSIQAHLSFPDMGGVYTGSMSLAGDGCAFAGLTDDVAAGCRFLPLDEDGNETGPAVTVEPSTMVGCASLGKTPDGWSFLTSPGTGPTPLDLVRVGPTGKAIATTTLPQADLAYGGRSVLRDGSFLLSTFEETDASGNAAAVQHFSADGAPLASAAQITDGAESILPMVQTSAGVMVSWEGFDPAGGQVVFVRALDTDGHPTAPAVEVEATLTMAMYGSAIAGTPNGDVILMWFDLDEATSFFDLHVIALGPDGAPRGAPTPLGTFEVLGDPFALVDAAGDHALLLLTGAQSEFTSGVLALPITCAP
jgi:hypothetical protein